MQFIIRRWHSPEHGRKCKTIGIEAISRADGVEIEKLRIDLAKLARFNPFFNDSTLRIGNRLEQFFCNMVDAFGRGVTHQCLYKTVEIGYPIISIDDPREMDAHPFDRRDIKGK